MFLGLLEKGDTVMNVTADFVAIRRENQEVDIVPIMNDEGVWRVDVDGIVTIGYGCNTVSYETENGVTITTC